MLNTAKTGRIHASQPALQRVRAGLLIIELFHAGSPPCLLTSIPEITFFTGQLAASREAKASGRLRVLVCQQMDSLRNIVQADCPPFGIDALQARVLFDHHKAMRAGADDILNF